MAENKLADLSMDFAVSILKVTDGIKGLYSLINQLERSATSIGANIREAKYAHSKADFISKLQIALKECYETEYWLELMQKSEIFTDDVVKTLLHDCGAIRRILISSINTPNQYLYLCKEMLSAYASLNGAVNTSDLEANALLIDGNRITGTVGTSWILNQTGKAERLGDSEVDNVRYVYLFPIWKAQTFSINISLNITAQNLKNLHERDSSFAIALYDSSKDDCTKAAGVNSNYYTFNKNAVTTTGVSDPSKYYYYYNEIFSNFLVFYCLLHLHQN
jgi:four helix bundle protein